MRRPGLALLAGLLLGGCASEQPTGSVREKTLLSHAQILTGARLNQQTAPLFNAPPRLPASGQVSFLAPVAAAARNQVIYIADLGHRQVFRYDAGQMQMVRFADIIPGNAMSMAVAPDTSLFLADASEPQVQQFSWDGRLLRTFAHQNVVARPVGIALDDATRQLFVADSLYNHVVVFNSLGRALGTLKSVAARSLEAMTRGPDGLYLVDSMSRQVVVMGLDGIDRYAFGSEVLKLPHAIAVDRYNRVFVSDDFDNTIKVFDRREMVASIGGAGSVPAGFNRVSFLSLDHHTLYVADTLNGRIKTFQLAPPRDRNVAPE